MARAFGIAGGGPGKFEPDVHVADMNLLHHLLRLRVAEIHVGVRINEHGPLALGGHRYGSFKRMLPLPQYYLRHALIRQPHPRLQEDGQLVHAGRFSNRVISPSASTLAFP